MTLEETIKALTEKNDRLRAALKSIADNASGAVKGEDGELFVFDEYWCRDEAKNALKQK